MDFAFDDTIKYFEILGINPAEFEEMSVEELAFSVRVSNCLKKEEVFTVADLLRMTPEDLCKVKNFGKKCVDEVLEKLTNISGGVVTIGEESSLSQKKMSPAVSKYAELIADGDFSFVLSPELSMDDVQIIEELKNAYEYLDEELVLACIYTPEDVLPVVQSLQEFIRDENKKENYRNRLKQELLNVPKERALLKSKNFIKAYTEKDVTKDVLFKVFADGEKTIKDCTSSQYIDSEKTVVEVIKFLKWCSYDMRADVAALFEELYSRENVKVIVKNRSIGKTLEYTGHLLGVTRERIRQIEAKTKKNYNSKIREKKFLQKISAERGGDELLTIVELAEYFGEHTEELVWFLKDMKDAFVYDEQLESFVMGDDNTKEKVASFVDELPNVIYSEQLDGILKEAEEEYELPIEAVMKSIEDGYNETDGTYHRIKMPRSSMYLEVIKKCYPEGIRAYDEDELAEFRAKIRELFGEVDLPENDRAISARITDLCMICDRGLYMPKKKKYISDELAKEIYDYIKGSDLPLLPTGTIYSVFEDELAEYDVNNRFYLQGILRSLYEDEFIFRRDYISKDASITSFYAQIVSFIKQFDRPVQKEKIQQTFPGVTDIVISLAVEDSSILNYFGEYLHKSKLVFMDDEIEWAKSLIENIIKDGQAHHVAEIHDIIINQRSELLTRNASNHHFRTYSLLESLFQEKYQFLRPYIAAKGVDIGRPGERLHDLIYSEDSYTISGINNFAKENRYPIWSLLEYACSCNDKYLMTDDDTIMDIEKIGVTEVIAKRVEEIIFDNIAETTPVYRLECIDEFPKVNVPWTDWLVYSVIRKWGTIIEANTSSGQLRHANPLVAPVGKMDVDKFKDMPKYRWNKVSADNLENIDELLEDIIEFEVDI